MKRIRIWVAVLGAVIAVSGMMTTSAHAYSYSQLVRQVFADHGSNPDLPLIYRDDNYSIVFQDEQQNEYVFGAVVFNSIRAGNNEIPQIKDIASSPAMRQDLPQDDAPAIGGLFLAEAIGVADDPENENGSNPYQFFSPAASGDYSFTDSEGNDVDINWDPTNSGALLQLFADDDGDFTNAMESGPQQAYDAATLNLLAEIGFLNEPTLGAEYEDLEEYYAVELEFDEEDNFVGPREFVGNLNVLDDWGGMFPGIQLHDGGQEVHLWGSIQNDPTGGWAVSGDGGRISFIIPSPVAVGPGLALLGVLALLRKPRMEREEANA